MNHCVARWGALVPVLASMGLVIAACSSTGAEGPVAGVAIEAVETTASTSVASEAESAPQPSAVTAIEVTAGDSADTSAATGGDSSAAATAATTVVSSPDASTTTSIAATTAPPAAAGAAGTPNAGNPSAGNPDGSAAVPVEGRAVDTSQPTQVIGDGRPQSCTSQAVVDAVAAGGIITFNCGPAAVIIPMTNTAKVVNDSGPEIVLDGGGKVTLSGEGRRRILYMNTCDQAQGFTTSHCQNQDHPRLTVQNLTFADGNATGERTEGGGGGAVFVRGGRFKVVNSTFVRNRCDGTGPDVGGAALRVLSQYEGRPVYVVNSTFGGAPGQGGICSNGGAISSIGVSWVVVNSVMTDNRAVGNGANPAKSGTPGGGSGGAIYLDGNRFTIDIRGSRIEDNDANEGGGAVFFVSNDRTGTMSISDSVLRRNPSGQFETTGYPGIFFLGASNPSVSGSVLE